MRRSVEKRLQEVIDFHAPRRIVVQEYKDVKTGLPIKETKEICAGCEVQWWPCTTYKLATGAISNIKMEVDTSPFGTVRTGATPPPDDYSTRESRHEAERRRRDGLPNPN